MGARARDLQDSYQHRTLAETQARLEPGDQLTHTVEVESVSPEKTTGLGVGLTWA